MTQPWDPNKFTLPDPPYNYRPSLQLEPIHMDLDLKFDIPSKRVWGSNTITFVSNNPYAKKVELNAIDFNAVSITADGVFYEYDGEKISIRLDTPVPRGEKIKITINYEVVDPIAGLYFSYPDDSYPDRGIYVASDHETERARYWLPSIDHPSVRTTFNMSLTAAKDLTILGLGEQLTEKINGDMKTVVWKHNYPCPTYITAIAIGEFIQYQDRTVEIEGQSIPISYFTVPSYDPEHLAAGFDRTPEIMDWFHQKFKIPFPWAKYYQFSLPRIFGAMENQTLVSWSDYAILNKETRKEIANDIDSVNVHEMAHTYFGDMVVSKDWSHAWLKESWATYCSALYLEDNRSKDEFYYDMYLNADRYFSEAEKRYIRPIVNHRFHSSWELFDRHLYPGGAWRLHMLRQILGNEIFFQAVIDYINTYKGTTVETVDFMRKLEEHSGLMLSKFFDQWVLQPKGFPKLSLEFSYNSEDRKGTFTIKQKQVKEDSDDTHTSPFSFNLDLYWCQDSEIEIRSVSISNPVHEFSFVMEEPDFVFTDPEHKVLFQLSSKFQDKQYRAMLYADDLFARIHAAKQLTDSGKRKNIEVIEDAYFQEEFWGVRLEYVKALGSSNSRFAIPILVKILTSENDPLILKDLPEQVTKYRDPRISQSLNMFANRDLPPFAKAAAIKALGSQRSETSIKIIKTYLDDQGWKYMNRVAAFTALSKTRSSEFIDLLLENIKYGKQPEIIRRGLITALGRLGKWQNNNDQMRIREHLEDLLREEYAEIRESVARALGQMGSQQSVAKIEKIYGLHPHQDVVSLKKLVNSIRKKTKDSSKYTALTKRLEDVEEKLAKLDEKIQKLSSSQ